VHNTVGRQWSTVVAPVPLAGAFFISAATCPIRALDSRSYARPMLDGRCEDLSHLVEVAARHRALRSTLPPSLVHFSASSGSLGLFIGSVVHHWTMTLFELERAAKQVGEVRSTPRIAQKRSLAVARGAPNPQNSRGLWRTRWLVHLPPGREHGVEQALSSTNVTMT
jgi:hypothetical protein